MYNPTTLLLFCVLLSPSSSQDGSDAPVFEPLFSPSGVTFTVDEGATEDTEVGLVRAQGLPQETVLYGIQGIGEEWEGAFEIGTTSGEITVGPTGPDVLIIKNGLPLSINFQVYAYYESAGSSGNRSNLSVTVEVEDVNSSPYFDSVDTDISLVEGVMVGDVVQRFTASDDDLGVNAALQYTLEQTEPNGDTNDSFVIHQFTGDLIIADTLSLGFTYRVIITATDEGSPPLSASLNVSIRMDPVPPTFGQPVYEADLFEFTDEIGVDIVNVSATAMSGRPVTYSVVSWNPAPGDLNFTVGSSTGLVEAAGTLDRETFSRYTVTVKAYEYPDTNTEATVVVHVRDVNEPPEFLRSHYSASVSEGAKSGDLLYSDIEALDKDEGSNSEVTYSIVNISGLTTAEGVRVAISEAFFTINSSTADLYVNTNLEREAEVDGYHYYEITVVAADGGSPSLSASSLVTVTVTDINDNSPSFSLSRYSFTVLESIGEGGAVGTVQVSDRDEGQAANITFSLSGSGSDQFQIAVLGVTYPPMVQSRPPTITKARIYTIEELDREEMSHYQLTVLAQDTTDQPLTGTAQIVIEITDYNDNAPQFDKDTFTFQVLEETLPENNIIAEISASDDDEGSNAVIDFTLAIGTTESLIFSLQTSNSTVALQLLRTLDREATDFYSLRLQAMDRGSPSLVSEVTINITVLDVNDVVPVFTRDPYEVNVTEETEVGTALLNVTAIDTDIEENAAVSYSTLSPFVTVDASTGEVELATMLDYEMDTRLEIEITAIDSGSAPLTGTTTVVINVVDINDNSPQFERFNYTVMVEEDIPIDTELIRVSARDADSGERGYISYSLSGSMTDAFAVDSITGAVTVAVSLDREQRAGYEFPITAVDMGIPPLSSTVWVFVIVLDVNDNPPVFGEPSYITDIPEGISVNRSLGETVLQVTATDDDVGSNGAISYSLSGSDVETFAIDPNTGVVTVARPLDYETVSEPYTLTVIARDNGSTPMSAAVTLQITVTDSNDHAPTFLGLPYIVRLEEGTTGPLLVLVAMATDLDEGSNGEIEFLFLEENGLFEADIGGNVSLLAGREVDREGEGVEVGENGEGVLTLTLTAVDNGSPIQLTQTDISILISDVNDNPPVFQQPSYYVQVSEALPVNSSIVNILATDADSGSNADIVYAIESQQPEPEEHTFTINSQTGVLYLSSALDRESHPLFSLTISATDHGVPSFTTTVSVVINVTDTNDNHPIFTIPAGGYVASLAENTPLGSEVITVVATDRDLGLHSQITYSLSNTSAVPFQIQNPEIGLITISSPLDRELVAQYNLIVVATDTVADSQSTLQTEAVVTITVLDVNDNAPQFVSTSYEGRVDENHPPGTTITLFPDLIATDADTASNGVVTYTLLGADSQYFSLDPQTAEMTTQQMFDAEVMHTYSDLQVMAADNGSLTSTVPLVVYIGDENDLSPYFTIGVNATVTASEALLPGANVFVVTATDGDVWGNVLNFTLGGIVQDTQKDVEDSPFVLDSATGAITVADSGLDFELSSYYLLTVIVHDSGSPPRSNSTQLLIRLTDVNDNSPVFFPPSQSFHLLETSAIGTTVGRVVVSDADSREITELQYWILSGNEGGRFSLDSTTGDIMTSADIDREQAEQYNLIIEARDGPELFLASTGTAVITIGDINDHTPLFVTPLTVGVTEGMSPGTSVMRYSAMDPDAGENGTLIYRILSSFPEDHFTINSTTGEVSTAIELDRETIDTYLLIIEANDGGTPSLTGTGNLTIEVVDINDNSPQFLGSNEATIIEHPLVGSLVSSNLTAVDEDEGSNAELTWRIESGNVFDAFRIDTTTGAILVQNATELDFEITPIFFLQLVVEDGGEPPLSSEVVVRVSLLDANDHAPIVFPLPPVTLPENTPVNGIVTVVTATDEDEGSNADLEFLIVSGNTGGVFGVRSDGSLRIIAALDYESVTQYDLVIEVHDRGTPPLIDSTTVTVNVTDINDNAPVFTDLPASVQITENAQTLEILTIAVYDPDSGDNGLYKIDIISANGRDSPSPFVITFTFLRAEGPLDYEEESQYLLVLEVSDHGNPPLSTREELLVMIQDADDNPPTFPEPPHYIISEGQPILTPFAILQTEDLDTPENSNAFYYITGGVTAEYFDVFSQTGQLFLAQLVDRETVPVHEVEVTAQSFQGDSEACTELTCSVTTVTVTLVDVNDNVPQWILKEFIIGVNETALPNDTIGMIEAVDQDDGDFGVVWYQLTDPSTPLVTLEEQTGVLHLKQDLSELQSRVSPVFTAVAFDNHGEDPSMTSMNIAVRIVSVSSEYLVVVTISSSLDQVREDLVQLYRAVEMIPGARLSVYTVREHSPVEDELTKRQNSETDVVIFGLSSGSGALLTSEQLLEVLSNVTTIADIAVSAVTTFPTPSSADEAISIDRLTLTIVVASVIIGVLIVVLLVTICGCCWLQNRVKNKRKYYDPGQRHTHRRREPREGVRYSTAEGVEFWGDVDQHADVWGRTEEHAAGWEGQSEENHTFNRQRVQLRGKKGKRQATDSGTRPWDSRDSEEIRGSVLYESKEYVMDCFEDSDGDEAEEEEEDVEISPATHFAAHTAHERGDQELLELQERHGTGYHDEEEEESWSEEGSWEEGDDDTLPVVRPQSQLVTVEEEGEEEEEEEEGEGEEEGEEDRVGAEVWEEGEGEVWEEDELSPADMMTEEEARMLSAPLEEDSPTNPLLY